MAIGSAIIGAIGADQAADAQRDAARDQLGLSRDVYNQQTEFFEPYRQSGVNALNAQNFELGLGARPEGYQGFHQTPGYQFQLDQGQRAIDNSAASRGNLFSSATLDRQQRMGQGLANQEYNNYLNRLTGTAGAGQAAAGQQAGAAGAMGAQGANALGNMGNAQSAGIMGVTNALNSGIGQITGMMGYQNGLN